jgi:hypothetical protein
MKKKMVLILCAVIFSVTTVASVTLAATPEDEKHMWTVTVKCTNKVKTLTETHCGKKGEAISVVRGQLKLEKGCGEREVVSAEKGDKCN